MKILLTGATGFVGSHLARILRERGHDVLALVRKNSDRGFLEKLGVEPVYGDLAPGAGPLKLPRVDAAIHLAGLIKARSDKEFHDVNARGTGLLVDALPKNLERLVLVSSIAARGPNAPADSLESRGPVSEYGKSKLGGERVAAGKLAAEKLVVIRPPVVYGPGDRATLDLFRMFKRGFFPLVGGAKNGRMSFVYVEDLAAILAESAAAKSVKAAPYYSEDGRGGYPWREVLDTAGRVFGRRVTPVPVPTWTAGLLAAGSEFGGKLLGKTPMFTRDKFREIRQPSWFCHDPDCHRDFKLGNPVTIDRGFAAAKEWYETQGWL